MSPEHTALGRALAFSLLLHAVLIVGGGRLLPQARNAVPLPAKLSVWLREEPASPQLVLPAAEPALREIQLEGRPEPAKPAARQPRLESPRSAPPSAPIHARLAGEAAQAANRQIARELAYPLEAIERGLEGEVGVLLFLDASGNVIASRVESSSGYAVLDEAALRAARTLRSLPDSAPRETLLPVRFRLR